MNSKAAEKLLVVDDYVDGADALTSKLRLEGFKVYTAYSGPDAVALAARVRPRVLLLDIAMPNMDGHELARIVRRAPWGHTSKLIAISGFDTSTDIRRSHEAGFDYHLVKPVDFDTLLALIDDPSR